VIDELQRLKNFRAGEPPPTNEAASAARTSLAQVIASESRRRTRRPTRIRARRARALAVVALAAAAVALVSLLGSAGSPAGPAPAIAAVFEQLARVVTTQSLTPRHGQYLYVDSRAVYPETWEGSPPCVTLATQHRQIWIGADGSGLLRESSGPVTFTSAADRTACRNLPSSALQASPPANTWFAPQCLSLGPTNNWGNLSTDPRVLLRQMRKLDGGPRTPAEDFVHIGDFLRETPAPPAVRAAIYRAAELIPGIRLLGRVTDHIGRPGLGVAYISGGSTSELIFDPQSGELFGEQGFGPAGHLEYWAVYLRERVVNRLPSRPPGPLTPSCRGGGGRVKHTARGDVMTGS